MPLKYLKYWFCLLCVCGLLRAAGRACAISKRITSIASTGARRDPRFPNVPTVSESGLKGYDATWRQAIFAPAGTPQPILQKLTEAIKQAVQSPTLPAKMDGTGFVPEYEDPQALAGIMAKDTEKFRKISQEAHLHLD